ncbi:MAG TPA: hypothetical protein VKY45_01825, partial [Marinilabiliaceae bacterium]|nr:hypothetical protein [Marinilabiliaceae bacterium]
LISNPSEIFCEGTLMVSASKSTFTITFGSASTALNNFSKNSSETTTGSSPLFKALFLKMSAKKLDTTTLKPYP